MKHNSNIELLAAKLPPDERLSEIYAKYYEKQCPIDAFPKLVLRVAKSIHDSQNLPMEFLCFVACGIISGTLGRSVKAVKAVNAFEQSPNLFLLGLGASSSGKSASLNILSKPLLDMEASARIEYSIKLAKLREEKQKAKTTLFDGSSDEPKEVPDKEQSEETQLTESDASTSETPQEPSTKKKEKLIDPTFIVMNATSESIAKQMTENGGLAFSLCAEARGQLAITSGLYKKEGDDTDIYNSGWSGEMIRQNRISRENAEIRNPCLSILWLVQFDAFRNIMVKKDNFKASGFAGRFVYFKSPNEIPFDDGRKTPLDCDALFDWTTQIMYCFDLRMCGDVMKLEATPDASEVFRAFHNEQIALMNGELRSIQDILGKARENAVRLAIIFAMADNLTSIDATTAQNACKVIKYSLYNAIEFYTSGLLASLENKRIKMEKLLREKSGKLSVSYFDQFKGLHFDEIKGIVSSFPDLYSLRKEGNGRYVYLKELFPNIESDETLN